MKKAIFGIAAMAAFFCLYSPAAERKRMVSGKLTIGAAGM